MIAVQKHTSFITVTVLLIGFLLINPAFSRCVPMLSDFHIESPHQKNSGCCDSKKQSSQHPVEKDLATNSHGCVCCGCGLQNDGSTIPAEFPVVAVIGPQSNELMASWRTISTVTLAAHFSATAYVNPLSATLESTYPEFEVHPHYPPLFILHRKLLN